MGQIKRFNGAILIEVNCGNPNGDPEVGGAPRVFDDGHGVISAVSIKRKYRDLLMDHNNPVTSEIMEKTEVDPESLWIFESPFKGFDTNGDAVKAIKEVNKYTVENGEEGLLKKFWDARTFGVTGLEKVKKDKSALSIKRTGGISLSDAISINPVEVVKYDITKTASLRDDLAKTQQNDIAPEGVKFVRHGLYFAKVTCDVKSAHTSLMTEDDVNVFKTLTPHIFSQSISTARPAGSIQLVHFWVKYHEQTTCSFNERKFWEDLKPIANNPGNPSESLADYQIPTPKQLRDRDNDSSWDDVVDWVK